MSKIFSNLDKLGFSNIDHIDLYKEKITENTTHKTNKVPLDELSLLYDRKVICPICGHKFNTCAVKTSSYRMKKKDSDFFIHYDLINPYFYDVWICNSCGYSSMKIDFHKIRNFEKDLILKNITCRWRGRNYIPPFNTDIAIERYKLALLNYFYINSKSSSKALTCLKIAWMYRLKDDFSSEINFLKQSLTGFEKAYSDEDFPIYGMDRFTIMYLIGELNRRLDKNDEALKWFSKVLTAPNISQKLKELARDQKDLIKKITSFNKGTSPSNSHKKRGLFSSIFNKN